MDRAQIIQMALEAGATDMPPYDYGARVDSCIFSFKNLERFAAAIRAVTKEEDAKICDDYANEMKGDKYYHDACSSFLAESIRASK